MFDDWEELEGLDESLQAEFDRDFEKEFGPPTDDEEPITLQQFKEESKRMQRFVDRWRSLHGL